MAEQQREQEREKPACAWKKKPQNPRRWPTAARVWRDKDFQLRQALNQLKNQPVLVSKTLTERKEEKKDN